MLGVAAVIELLDRRSWFARKYQLAQKVKLAKEAVQRGNATEEQKELDKEYSTDTVIPTPVEWVITAFFRALWSHRLGRILIELWLCIHGVLLLVAIPEALRNEPDIFAWRLTIWWFYGFVPALGLFGATAIALVFLWVISDEQTGKVKKLKGAALRNYMKWFLIIAGATALATFVAIYLGWVSKLLNLYPPAWDHLIILFR